MLLPPAGRSRLRLADELWWLWLLLMDAELLERLGLLDEWLGPLWLYEWEALE